MLVSLLVDEFLSERSVKLGVLSRKEYGWGLARLVDWLAEQGVTDTANLTLPVLVRYLSWLREAPTKRGTPRTSETVMTAYRLLHCLLKWAVLAEYLPARALRLPAPPQEHRISGCLAVPDAKKLVRAASGARGSIMQARDTAITLLLLDTGIRASELCSLSVDDVRLDEGWVLVRHGKGNKWRQVGPLSDRTVQAQKQYKNVWRPKQHPQTEAFFVSRKRGSLGRRALGHLTRRLKARGGVEGKSNPHAFRHGYSRSQAIAGTPTHVLSALLGHSNLVTTQRYLSAFSSADARRMVSSVVDSL